MQKARRHPNGAPTPVYGKRCKACSLVEVCQPKLMEKDRSVGYVAGLFGDE